VLQDFAKLWRAADKIVYSKTLERVSTARTRIEWTFEPEAVRLLKAQAMRDILIGGPTLAAHAFKAGLWTSAICSSHLSSWEAAHRTSRTMFASGSSCWTNAVSTTAWSTSAIAPGCEETEKDEPSFKGRPDDLKTQGDDRSVASEGMNIANLNS
jgi:hypothetical protein